MKRLLIKTVRLFKTDQSWEDYKNQMETMAELKVDYHQLEKTGNFVTQQKPPDSRPDEQVITSFSLIDYEKV